MRLRPTIFLILPALFWLIAAAASAATFGSGPYVFSDELGGFRLKSVSGSGSTVDPIVLVEEFFGIGPAILTVRRVPSRLRVGPRGRENFPSFINVEKIVVNRSRRGWVGFDLELEEVRGEPSTHRDGLSFDQISQQTGRLASNRFAIGERTFDPGDRLLFFDGGVDPGDSVRFSLLITDTSPHGTFYLIQRPQFATSGIPGTSPSKRAAHAGEPKIGPLIPVAVKAGLGAPRSPAAWCVGAGRWPCSSH